MILNRVAERGARGLLRRACDDRSPSRCSAACRATPRWPCRAGISAWSRRRSTRSSRRSRARRGPGRARVDLDRLLRLARPFGLGLLGPAGARCGRSASGSRSPTTRPSPSPIRRRLDGWRAPAPSSCFSPLADEAPDPGADAVYLPGGYPELHAGPLAANAASWTACARQRPGRVRLRRVRRLHGARASAGRPPRPEPRRWRACCRS